METAFTVNVPVKGIYDDRRRRALALDLPISATQQASLAAARRAIKNGVEFALEAWAAHHAARSAQSRRLYACNDGTILVLEYDPPGWLYRICGPDRAAPSSTVFPSTVTHTDAMRKLRDHAEQAYGGIAWECYL